MYASPCHISHFSYSICQLLPSLNNSHERSFTLNTYIFRMLSEIIISLRKLSFFHIISSIRLFTFHLNNILNHGIYLERTDTDHPHAVEALFVLPCCYYCTMLVIPSEFTSISHKLSSFKDRFHNSHINSHINSQYRFFFQLFFYIYILHFSHFTH
jgi:hypothetical protein